MIDWTIWIPSGYDVLYRTGDFARYIKGNLVFEGRTDSQLKVRGHRVDLSEVETSTQGIRGVEKCHVICYHPGEVDQVSLHENSNNYEIKQKTRELVWNRWVGSSNFFYAGEIWHFLSYLKTDKKKIHKRR